MEHKGYWKPGKHGYTPKIAEAGRYSLGEADQICKNSNCFLREDDVPEEFIVLSPEYIKEYLK